MKTTFEKIKLFTSDKFDFEKLLKYYNPISLDEEITIEEIFKSNGIQDAVRTLGIVQDKKTVMLFLADVAESVLHMCKNKNFENKSHKELIQAIRDYSYVKISEKELIQKIKLVIIAMDDIVAVGAAGTIGTYAYANAYSAASFAVRASVLAALTAVDTDNVDTDNVATTAVVAAGYAAAAKTAGYAAAAFAAHHEKWKEIENLLLKYL